MLERTMFVLELGRHVAEAYRQQSRYLQEKLGYLGLSPRSLPFIILLAKEGPLSPSAMSERLHSDKTRTAKALRILESRAYVERSHDETDRRVKKIRLTDKGRQVYPEIRSILDRMDGIVDEVFNKDELLRTGEILNAYSEALKGSTSYEK